VFWLELLGDARIVPAEQTNEPLQEANQLLAIFAASQRTAKAQARGDGRVLNQ
jgi:hypothetical protein